MVCPLPRILDATVLSDSLVSTFSLELLELPKIKELPIKKNIVNYLIFLLLNCFKTNGLHVHSLFAVASTTAR